MGWMDIDREALYKVLTGQHDCVSMKLKLKKKQDLEYLESKIASLETS